MSSLTFLTLLHIWSAISTFREKKNALNATSLRKYCKQHFLSFRRVLEWDQIVRELSRLVRDTSEGEDGSHCRLTASSGVMRMRCTSR